MQVERVMIDELDCDPANVRAHDAKNLDAIKSSLKRFGQQKPIVVNEKGIVIAGNGTLTAARALGWDSINIVKTELDGVNATAYAIADNRTGELAEWDNEALAKQLSALQIEDEALVEAAGFSDAELTALVDEVTGITEGNTDPDEVPEVPEEPTAQAGQVWQLGNHRLMCGDSTSAEDVAALMDGQKADMVFTDPPYGVEYQSNMSKRFEQIKNDDTILEIAPVIWQFLADDSGAFVWTSHHVYPVWRQQFDAFYKQTIIWAKGGGGMGDLQGQYALDYEMALFCVKGSPRFEGKRGMAVWDIGKDSASGYVHPTQKPVALAEQALNDFTKAKNITLDLFGGSGSTLIACERLSRHCRMMELEPAYCDVIIKRWEDFTGQTAELVNG